MYKQKLLRSAALTLLGVLFAVHLQAASFRGSIVDASSGEPMIAATVIVTGVKDTTQRRYATAAADGSFVVNNLPAQAYRVEFAFIGYDKISQNVNLGNEDKNLGKIRLRQGAVEMAELQVAATAVRATQRGDTTDFLASAYKVTQDATTEDLLKKMPGITVEGNVIKTQGEEVKRVLVDGKPFFGDDPNMAIKNLPAEVIAKIETYTKLSEQAQLTGVDDGEGERTINIVTRPDRRMGQFGRVYAGVGYDDKQDEIRYSAGGNINLFNQTRRISVVGMSNNVNQQNFSAEDMSGMSSGGGRGAGRFMSSNAGVATTNALGLNYSESFGTKLDLTGSYFLNVMDNDNESSSERNYVAGSNENTHRSQRQNSSTETYNHRLNMKLDYKVSDRTSLLIQPAMRFTTSASERGSFASMSTPTTILSESENKSGSDQTRFNMNSEFLLRHKFMQPGRTLSLSVRVGADNTDNDSYQQVDTKTVRDTTFRNQKSENPVTNWTTRARLLYTEPFGKRGLIQLGYNLTVNPSKSNRHTYNFIDSLNRFDYDNPDSMYSNIYSNEYNKHDVELVYRFLTEKMNASVGVEYEYAMLNGRQTLPVKPDVKKSFNTLLPEARIEYKFTKHQTLRAFYRTNTNAPSVSQLQSVIDNTSDLLLRSGNPNLKQTFSQMLGINYNQTSLDQGVTVFAQLWGTTRSDNISNFTITNSSLRDTTFRDENTGNVITLEPGSQYSTYRNMNGYYSLRTAATIGMPVPLLRSNLNLTAGLSYTSQPGFANGMKNIAYTTSPSGGATLGSNISEKLDFTLSYRATYNIVKNTLESRTDNSYFQHSASFSGTWITWKDITLRGTATYAQEYDFSQSYNQEYLRIDASIGKKFLKSKNAELRFSVYDLLNQAKSYSRNVTAEYVEDAISNVLSRYYMLTFTYTLRNFGTPPVGENRDGERRNPREGGFGRPPGGGRGGFGPPM